MIGYNLIASPGRLGNQMYKFAALKGISKNLGYSFCIPPSFPIIEKSKIISKIVTKNLLKQNKHNHLLFESFNLKSLNKRNIGFLKTNELIKEKSFNFDSNIFNNCPDNINIWGFFQTEKYFLNVREELLQDFSFKKSFYNRVYKVTSQYEQPVSIHIRRTDYLTNNNHSPLDLKYYEDAISFFPKDRTFFVFTDDVDWVTNQKLFSQKNFVVLSNIFNNKYLDLCAMTLCNDHIIANSSFSWWGAWLSDQNNVISPKNWFKNSKLDNLDTSDLIPDSWVKINN